jgi:receptor protein-tyrosine kinase
MSRNFELLTEVEHELKHTDVHGAADANRVVSKPVVHFARKSGEVHDEQMQKLIQSVFLSMDRSGPHAVVFCGIDEKNGSASVCARAARALAVSSGQPICLVDGNVQSPRLTKLLGIDTAVCTVKSTSSIREKCAQIDEHLWFAGPALLAGGRSALPPVEELRDLLAQLRGRFEYVLIDAPATNVSGDAVLLSQTADSAILVIDANITRRLTARKAKETFDAAGVRLAGTVLYNRTFPIPERLYRIL